MDVGRLSAALMSLDTSLNANPVKAEETPEAQSFGTALQQALDRVEQDQKNASDAAVQLATGQVSDIAEVMIASERANLSLGLAVQVRNKVLEAYQEIMRMPL